MRIDGTSYGPGCHADGAKAAAGRSHHNDAAHQRREFVDDLAKRSWKQIDAAHNQHVVGAADTADPRCGASTAARRRPQADVIAATEAKQGRGALA